MSPEALIAGFEGHSCETVDTDSIPTRYKSVCENKSINLGLALDPESRGHPVRFDIEKDLVWLWDCVLPQHPNGFDPLDFIFPDNLRLMRVFFHFLYVPECYFRFTIRKEI